ncbi:hypothetical protein B0G57_102275 [Trinickia symbiotica]|uniref:Lipoprotein n=1 Tax=Trinickia symbiotica TaxID=863227 RepID=A0A2N7XB25_9BURK|nr:hypothetical protein [Trinickia symbiotica]PMS38665.1 hypothetical protein C0Z20_02050 [Trinickia symbiotica]PPK46680.1 hypothetical protein B0G57_102275 [Trinickia symbiotica]
MKNDCIHIARQTLAFAASTILLGGCMTSTPIWDAHFGEAVRAVTQAQIIDPQAGEHNPSTPGVDGKAAVSAMTTYNKSFDAPPPTVNQFVIGVGGGGGGGGGQ